MRRPMNAPHVEPLIRMRHDVAKPRGAPQPFGESAIDVTAVRESSERISVRARRSELQVKTRRRRQIDDDLRRLPEMQDHRVRLVGRGSELIRIGRKSRRDAREMTLNGRNFLGQYLSIERAQRSSSARTSS
jgi:hypothetical protein